MQKIVVAFITMHFRGIYFVQNALNQTEFASCRVDFTLVEKIKMEYDLAHFYESVLHFVFLFFSFPFSSSFIPCIYAHAQVLKCFNCFNWEIKRNKIILFVKKKKALFCHFWSDASIIQFNSICTHFGLSIRQSAHLAVHFYENY